MTSPTNQTNGNLMRERRSVKQEDLRICSGCSKFLGRKTYYKHKITCPGLVLEPIKPVFRTTTSSHKDQHFVEQILQRFNDNEVGKLCREDTLIQEVGYRHFCLRRSEKSKQDVVKKVIMSEMRELARIFEIFRTKVKDSKSSEDMFFRENIVDLRESVEELSQRENGPEKHGLKLKLNDIIRKTIKTLKGIYAETFQDQKYKDLFKYERAYDLRAPQMYATARQKVIDNSSDKARRPSELPKHKDLQTLKEFISEEIQTVCSSSNFDISKYAWLRSLIVCRLTLYNGRRGEEPSRMLLQEFKDALEGVWISNENCQMIEDVAEKYLIGQFRLAYLHGKGKKLVPVLIPNDLINPIQVLIANRREAGICNSNIFLFPSKASRGHCSGWHAVRDVCVQAGVSINATQNRHRISTIYASLDMSASDQKVFLHHMGHEETINKQNYQCPYGVREVSVMGRMLSEIDQASVSLTDCAIQTSKNAATSPSLAAHTVTSLPSTSQNAARPTPPTLADHSPSVALPSTSKNEARPTPPTLADHSPSVALPSTSKNAGSVHWTQADTSNLQKHFHQFFSVDLDHAGNKGRLPSRKEIMHFLDCTTPTCLIELSREDQYKKIRAKLFNERKTIRIRVAKRLKGYRD